MPEVMPQKSMYLSFETLAMGAAAETLATAGATVPQNAGEIVVFTPSGDSLHWLGVGTPTTSLGHRITLGHPAIIPHSQQKTAKFISDDGADVTVCLVYKRGSGRPDASYSLSEPF